MYRILAATAALALLTACGDGQPFDFGVVPPPIVEPPGLTEEEVKEQLAISESIAGGLDGGTYSLAAGTLTVRIPLDLGDDIDAEYERNPALDVAGYVAFSAQSDPLDRIYIGMAARSADNSVEGVLVSDAGQFGRFFGGTTFRQIGAYSESPASPNTGLVSYAGNYVGLSNAPATSNNIGLPVNPGTEPGLIPAQASRVTGNVFINADFGDNVVNGLIYNRTNLDANEQLNNVVLIVSTINSNGSFLGKVQSQPVDGTAPVAIGDYGGTFGGLNASGVAGGVHLENYLDNVENEQEYGIFVLTQCGLAGDGGAICDDVQPDF